MTNAIGTQAIGPTFTSELQAAGLVLPIPGFSWGSYGLDALPISLTAAQVTLINTVFQAHNPTKLPPQVADWTGFLKWMPTAFDAPTLNAFAKAYPTMLGFCQFGNAAMAQWCITDGKANLPLTAAQYALFQGANVTYHLGMTLP